MMMIGMFFLTLFLLFFLYQTRNLLGVFEHKKVLFFSGAWIALSSFFYEELYIFFYSSALFCISQFFLLTHFEKQGALGSWLYFFILLHLVHLGGGIILRAKENLFVYSRRYWHFLTGLWFICSFLLFYFT